MKPQPTTNLTLSNTAQARQQGAHWQFGQHSRRDDARIVSTTTTQGQGRDVACDISTENPLIIKNLQLIIKNTNPETPHPGGGGMIAFSFPYTPYPINPAIRAVSWDSIVAKQEESAAQLELVMDCLNQSPYIANNLLTILYDLEEVDAPETQLYYYHSDHLGSSSWITNTSGQATQHLAYLPFGENFVSQRLQGEPARYTFSAKEKDLETGYSYFGARYYESGLSIWLSVDPLSDEYPNFSSYVYCKNNPIILVDPNGQKDKPFNANTDKPVTPQVGTETPIYFENGMINTRAYNCHSYTWHNSAGDPTPAKGDIPNLYGFNLLKWDNSPADDINEMNAVQLGNDEDNIPGDIAIYYIDTNENSKHDEGENILHSATVKAVDKEGYTTEVIGKMGDGPISINHPDAPNYYQVDEKNNKTSRAYFRLNISNDTP